MSRYFRGRSPDDQYGRGPIGGGMLGRGRLVLGLMMAAMALISFAMSREENPITGETQFVELNRSQEIQLGIQSAPQMVHQYGGLLDDQDAQDLVDQIGERLVSNSDAGRSQYEFDFHVLADARTMNAFALPDGQIFITAALLQRLDTEAEIAGVLGHELGHVVARHGSQQLAKTKLTDGMTTAFVIANADRNSDAMAQLIGKVVNLRYGRTDELQSDKLGVRFMAQAGYDPRAMLVVMDVLDQASAGGGQPEFFKTHPNPDRRRYRITEAIQETFPDGIPEGLTP